MSVRTLVSSSFKIAPQHAGWSLDDIEMMMSQDELVFCNAYIKHNGNGSKAGHEVRMLNSETAQKYADGKFTVKRNQQLCSGKTMDMLKHSLVSSYLYLQVQKIRENARRSIDRNLESYTKKFEEIRDAALKDGDYSATIKAQKELGLLYGHTDNKDPTRSINNVTLIKVIAGGDMHVRRKLGKDMGLPDDVIEGELLE